MLLRTWMHLCMDPVLSGKNIRILTGPGLLAEGKPPCDTTPLCLHLLEWNDHVQANN